MVARFGLGDPLEVRLEVLLREEGGAVDPGQLLAVLVAAPVGARDRAQLDRLDPLGRGRVRAAAEVLEVAVLVERDGLDAFVGDQVLDQLDLEALVFGAEVVERLGDRDVAAAEVLVGVDVLPHLRFDLRQVVLGDRHPVGELEVVVEAGLDRRADRHLGAGVELGHRLGHHVGGVVADQLEPLGVALGDDRHLRPGLGQRRVEVLQLAVDLDRQRGLRQPRADRHRGVGAGRPGGQLERLPVGQGDDDLVGCGLHGTEDTGRQRAGPWRAWRTAISGQTLCFATGPFTSQST